MFCSFNRTETVTLNLNPQEWTGLSEDVIEHNLRRELGNGDWDERDLAINARKLRLAAKNAT
jgi:hypothetical protein